MRPVWLEDGRGLLFCDGSVCQRRSRLPAAVALATVRTLSFQLHMPEGRRRTAGRSLRRTVADACHSPVHHRLLPVPAGEHACQVAGRRACGTRQMVRITRAVSYIVSAFLLVAIAVRNYRAVTWAARGGGITAMPRTAWRYIC